VIAQQAVRDCGFVQLDHPAYSPDLALIDYFLFRNLKFHLHGVRYPDDELKRLRKLSRSGWRDRQKNSILVELTVCQKNVANAVMVLKNKLQF